MIFLYIIIATAILGLDFFSKSYVLNNVTLGETFGSFTPLIDFTYVQNTGAAFGMFSGRMNILAVISFAFCIGAIVYWVIKKPQDKLFCISLSMIFPFTSLV